MKDVALSGSCASYPKGVSSSRLDESVTFAPTDIN